MRIIAVSVISLLLISSSSVLAFSDPGLIKSPRTISYYLMQDTSLAQISSGLVYNQKVNQELDMEVLYTSYQSVYLLTRNVTQVNLHGKKKLIGLGPVALQGLAGAGLVYSPAVGGGLTADIGGVLLVNPIEEFAAELPIYASIFNDGLMLNVFGTLNVKPAFLGGYESYVGFRVRASVVGNFQQMQESGQGQVNMYLALGLRSAI